MRQKKVCPRCLVTKSHGEFHRDRSRSGGRSVYCKDCFNKNTRALRKAARLFNEVLARQGGVCAVCEQEEQHRGAGGCPRRLGIDLDRATGGVRGLLCHRCSRIAALLEAAGPIVAGRLVEYVRGRGV